MEKENYSPEYKRCIQLRKSITDTNDVLGLTKRAPDILARLGRGEKFPAESMQLAKKVGVDVNKDGTPTPYTGAQLQGFIDNKKENKEGLKETEAELWKLITEKNLPRQDSSDITSDIELFDLFDPDG